LFSIIIILIKDTGGKRKSIAHAALVDLHVDLVKRTYDLSGAIKLTTIELTDDNANVQQRYALYCIYVSICVECVAFVF
jgi:hypothetical protein